MPTMHSRSNTVRALLALASGGLVAASLVYPALFPLAWIALIPLLFALDGASLRSSYLYGTLAGLGTYVGATYWVGTFIATLKGYGAMTSAALALLLWMFSAQAFGIAVTVYQWLRHRTRIPALWLFSIAMVSVLMAFPTPFPAHIGESQSHFLIAIQGIEWTGIYGLDFIVTLANAVLFVWLARFELDAAGRVAAACLIGWFAFGVYARAAWNERIAQWEPLRIGVVQANEPPSVGIPPPPLGYARAYPPEWPLTQALASQGAELVIWPETRFKGYFEYDYVRHAYERHSVAANVPLLFNDIERVYADGARDEFNSVAFLDASGRLAGTYRKLELVPFGEYLPLGEYWPALKQWTQDYMGFYQLTAGERPKIFATERFAVTPLICYELAFPPAVARAVRERPQGTIVATVSNDTWFRDTRQAFMHGYIAAFRAVEQRTPVLNVINNGPSVAAMPDGRFLFRGDFRRSAGYLIDLPYSRTSGGTFFTLYPYAFLVVLYAALIAIVAFAIVKPQSR